MLKIVRSFRARRATRKMLVLLACVAGQALAEQGTTLDLHVIHAPSPVRVDGALRLVYELRIGNRGDTPAELARVEVLEAAGRTVADVDAPTLASLLAPTGTSAARMIAGRSQAVMYLDLAIDAARIPSALKHRVHVACNPAGARQSAIAEGGATAVDRRATLAFGPPLRGGPWAAIHDSAWPRGHRRMLFTVDGRERIPGRFAIDFVRLDADGHFARGDKDNVNAWLGYGEAVLAVADAVVASTRGDVVESASVHANPAHAPRDASGNLVSLAIGNGRHVFYEHLAPGSIRVRVGQRVKRGDVLGKLGFTGDSTGPHLHLHVADADSPLAAEGLPFVLSRFELLGGYASLDTFGSAPWSTRGAGEARWRRDEHPGSNVVVRFRP